MNTLFRLALVSLLFSTVPLRADEVGPYLALKAAVREVAGKDSADLEQWDEGVWGKRALGLKGEEINEKLAELDKASDDLIEYRKAVSKAVADFRKEIAPLYALQLNLTVTDPAFEKAMASVVFRKEAPLVFHTKHLDKQIVLITEAIKNGVRPSDTLSKMGSFSFYFNIEMKVRMLLNATKEELESAHFQDRAHEALFAFEKGLFGLPILSPRESEELKLFETLDKEDEAYKDGLLMMKVFSATPFQVPLFSENPPERPLPFLLVLPPQKEG